MPSIKPGQLMRGQTHENFFDAIFFDRAFPFHARWRSGSFCMDWIGCGVAHCRRESCSFLRLVAKVMQSKNKKAPTVAESAHIEAVKSLPCSVCDASGPSDCHEIRQGQWFTSVALCKDCHQGSNNGWHGRKAIWRVKKYDELDALAVTIQRLMY